MATLQGCAAWGIQKKGWLFDVFRRIVFRMEHVLVQAEHFAIGGVDIEVLPDVIGLGDGFGGQPECDHICDAYADTAGHVDDALGGAAGQPPENIAVIGEPYAKLKIDFGWLNAAHPVDANDSQ